MKVVNGAFTRRIIGSIGTLGRQKRLLDLDGFFDLIKGAQLRKHIDATLGSGNLREAVRLPPGEDTSEWLAVNTVDFFNQVNLLYGTLTEFCTAENCPIMSAGPKYEYRWADVLKRRLMQSWYANY